MGDLARPILQITGAVIGGAFGPVGAVIGATIGDQLGAAAFPQKVGEGPRLDELKVTRSAYGMPIPLVYGSKNRFAGQVIWYSGLQERRETREISKGNEVDEFFYSVSLAVALCEGPIASVSKIWANGKILWEGDFFSDSVTQATAAELAADANADSLEAAAAACGLESDPNCSDIWARANAARAQADAATAAKNAAIAAQSDYQVQFEPWTFTSDLAPGATFRFYPGTMTQEPDPTIEAEKGAGNTPAYRGICYLVIDDLELADFGNQLPNLEFEVISGIDTVRDALAGIHNKSGMALYDYSTNLTVDDALDGYIITRQMSSLAAISQLEQAYFFDTTEQYGQIRHVKRGRMNQATIQPGDMAASQERGKAVQPVTTERLPDETLPNTVTISYRDIERDYQPNTQRASRNKGSSQNNINLDFGITLSNQYARTVVDRLLWEPWTSRLSLRVTAAPKFGFLTPGDVVGIAVANAVTPFRIDRIVQGANNLVEIEARQDDPFIYQGSTDFVAASLASQGNQAPTLSIVDTIIQVFNAPVLSSGESSTAFNYAIDGAETAWRGGTLYRAPEGVTFSPVAGHTTRNITGDVATALGDANPALIDNVNTVRVVLNHDDHVLNSATDTELANFANGFWLGEADGSRGEIIQFKTATLVTASPKTYDLTGLLRGRRATEHELDQHVANEVFVLLETGYYRTQDYTAADIGATRYYKGVSYGQDEATVIPVQAFINAGEKAKPRSPTMIRGSRDGSNNLTLTWYRRIRGFSGTLGNSPLPLDEATESYEIDIIDGSNGVVRTITATSETATYTAAQQTTDGLTPGNAVTGKVYQISATVGRGYSGDFTV